MIRVLRFRQARREERGGNHSSFINAIPRSPTLRYSQDGAPTERVVAEEGWGTRHPSCIVLRKEGWGTRPTLNPSERSRRPAGSYPRPEPRNIPRPWLHGREPIVS